MRVEILHLLHKAHQGIRKTLQYARTFYFWPNMHKDIVKYIRECNECQKYQASERKEPLQQASSSFPFHKVSADFFQCEGTKTMYLVVVDRYSGFPFVSQMKTTTTAATIAKLENWFFDLIFPKYLKTDGGPHLTSGEFADWCKKHSIVHELSSSHYHESNGLAEAAVKQIQHLLCKNSGKF